MAFSRSSSRRTSKGSRRFGSSWATRLSYPPWATAKTGWIHSVHALQRVASKARGHRHFNPVRVALRGESAFGGQYDGGRTDIAQRWSRIHPVESWERQFGGHRLAGEPGGEHGHGPGAAARVHQGQLSHAARQKASRFGIAPLCQGAGHIHHRFHGLAHFGGEFPAGTMNACLR